MRGFSTLKNDYKNEHDSFDNYEIIFIYRNDNNQTQNIYRFHVPDLASTWSSKAHFSSVSKFCDSLRIFSEKKDSSRNIVLRNSVNFTLYWVLWGPILWFSYTVKILKYKVMKDKIQLISIFIWFYEISKISLQFLTFSDLCATCFILL